jgi:predicted small metal-binding protein
VYPVGEGCRVLAREAKLRLEVVEELVEHRVRDHHREAART